MLRYVEIGWRSGGRWLSLAVLGGLALGAPGVSFTPAVSANSAPIPAQTWLTFDSAHLCTAGGLRSHPVAGASQPASVTGVPLSLTTSSPSSEGSTGSSLVSVALAAAPLAPATQACATSAGSTATLAMPLRAQEPKTMLTTASAAVAHTTTLASHLTSVHVIYTKTPPQAPAAPTQATGYSGPPGGVGPWTPVAGHPSYSFPDFAGDPNSWEYGSCTWWAWYTRRDEPQLASLGYASGWIGAARARGMSVGYSPAVGATVVFQPGVQGASGDGHVGHVVALLSDGWFVMSEMNFYWNGGGYGRVNYRYAHVGAGVAFIY